MYDIYNRASPAAIQQQPVAIIGCTRPGSASHPCTPCTRTGFCRVFPGSELEIRLYSNTKNLHRTSLVQQRAGATTATTDVFYTTSTADLLQHQTAAAVAAGHARLGSASLVRSACVGLTLEPFVHVLDFVMCFLVLHSKFEDEKSTTLHVSNRASCSWCHLYYCCTTSTAGLLLLLRSLISRRVGLATPPTACLGGDAWPERYCGQAQSAHEYSKS